MLLTYMIFLKKDINKLNNLVINDIELLDQIDDQFNDTVDVAVKLKDGYSYVISVSTAENLLQEMKCEKRNFISPYESRIIVNKLSKEIINEAIEAHSIRNGYWLKLYQFNDEIDIYVLNKLEAQHREELALSELEGLDCLLYYIKKYTKIFLENPVFLGSIFFIIIVTSIFDFTLKSKFLNLFSNFMH